MESRPQGHPLLGSVTTAARLRLSCGSAAGSASLPSPSLCCCRIGFHTLMGLKGLIRLQCIEQDAQTGHLNLKRYLISSPKINSMQNPRNESWLVQGIWNRMWRFSPLALHFQGRCNTSPQNCSYIHGTVTSLWLCNEQLVLTKCHRGGVEQLRMPQGS